MRVTVFSHTYVVSANRGKIRALGMQGDAECQLVVPDRWVDTLTVCRARAGSERVVPLRAHLVGNGARYWMSPKAMLHAVGDFDSQLIHVEEEPFSIVALSCAWIAQRRAVPLTLFTWENLGRSYPPPFSVVRRAVLRRTAHVFAGNKDAACLLRQDGYAGPVSVLPQLGVRAYGGQAEVARSPGLRVGYVGRLAREKGISTLIEAVRLVEGASLRIVGCGPDERRLRRLGEAAGVGTRVRFEKSVPHDAVPAKLAALDVLVLPSLSTNRWKEQFGHVLIEAMACGVPVVGSSSGAIPEVIGDAGIVFREGDVLELAAALRQLRDSPALRGQLATAGRARVLANYTDEVLARRTLAVWKSVLEGKGAQPLRGRLGLVPCAG